MTKGDTVALAAWRRVLCEQRRLGQLSAVSGDAESGDDLRDIEERLADRLRPEVVALVVRVAERAKVGRDGERDRHEARALLGPYLDRACRPEDEVIAEHFRRAATPPGGIEASLAFEENSGERERLLKGWDAVELACQPARLARLDARDAAARAVGKGSAFALAACAEPQDPVETADAVERHAIRPLDDALGRASRARAVLAGFTVVDRGAWPRLARLVDFAPCFSRARVAPVLREIGCALGEDPDTHGPRLLRGSEVWDEAVIPPGTRAAVVSGSAGGPGGLRSALRAFGRAARGGAVGRRRGPSAAIVADAAFDAAAATLFSRLLLSPPFRSWSGVREVPALADALRLTETRDMRQAWARLRAAAGGPLADDDRGFAGPEVIETTGASELRGAIFAVLLEERLMTRHGRSWFVDRAAGRLLGEIWEAEPDETAESMAAALSLGRMNADVLAEGFRP